MSHQRSVVARRYSSTFLFIECLEVSSCNSFRCWRTQLWTLWHLKSETYIVILSRVKCLGLPCFGMIFALPCRNSWSLVKLSVGFSLYTFGWDTHIWPEASFDFTSRTWFLIPVPEVAMHCNNLSSLQLISALDLQNPQVQGGFCTESWKKWRVRTSSNNRSCLLCLK